MTGALSGHLINALNPNMSFNSSSISTHGAMSFNPMMHGTPYAQNSFSLFHSQPSFANDSISEETAHKIASLQSKLNRKLGPEYISQRPGPGGGPKLTYVEGWKIINLANEVFGFNGWSSSIVSLNTDFSDYSEETKRYCVGVTAIMRVTLRDGVFHEDIGYGMLENSKSKGAALDKCKKEAVTDGLKRALRNFGNVLGNCLYDKSYTAEVVKVKFEPKKFNKDELHRRPEFEDIKPNTATLSASTSGTYPNNNSHSNAMVTPIRPPIQNNQSKPSNALSSAASTSSTISNNAINRTYDSKGKDPVPPRQQQQQHSTGLITPIKTPIHTHIAPQPQSVAQPNQISKPMTKVEYEKDMDDDSFGFNSDDDALLALADLGPPIGGDDSDVGRPIEAEMDIGRPIHHDEGPRRSFEAAGSSGELSYNNNTNKTVQQTTTTKPTPPSSRDPNASKSRHELIAAALRAADEGNVIDNINVERTSAPVARQSSFGAPGTSVPQQTRESSTPSASSMAMPPPPLLPNRHPQQNQNQRSSSTTHVQQQHQRYMNQRQNQNQNQNLNAVALQNQQGTLLQPVELPIRSATPSIGGFHFPPGLQMNNTNISLPSTSGIGIKRPAEAMGSGHRGSRPGMGLEQAVSGQGSNDTREVFGKLEAVQNGEFKRRKW